MKKRQRDNVKRIKRPTTFGKRITYIREKLGKTQQLVADEIQDFLRKRYNDDDVTFSQTALANYENDVREPKCLDMTFAIAEYFQVSIDWLLGRTDDFGMPEEVWEAIQRKELAGLREQIASGHITIEGKTMTPKQVENTLKAIDKHLDREKATA
jgi:transcriptional regulator with XRE-family HTH domain